jgi:Lrp/AsnC family leucine-responsive transcriptional regulator
MAVDKFDLAILKVLQGDARASLLDISKRVGLSATPCWNRIRKMEADGVIQGYTARIDPAAIGFTETVIVQVTLESHTEETLYDFGRTLEQIPEVLEAYLVSGDYDYYIRIAVKDTRDYERLLRERLYRIPGIRHSKSSFVLRTLKESLIPLASAPVEAGSQPRRPPTAPTAGRRAAKRLP